MLDANFDTNDVGNIVEADSVKVVAKSNKAYIFFKRLFDVVSSACALVLLSWLLIIVAVIVKLTSKGPVLYKDHRIGKNGMELYILKFRTMFINAEEHIHDYLTDEQYKEWLSERKVENDPRITPVGRFLRRTSIDELPQLVNILKGDMSVVGPRPLTKSEIEENFTLLEQKKLLGAKPGLTGNWGAYGRSSVTFESGERQRMELEYVDKQCTALDLKIIFASVFSVLKGKGAQ